MVIESPLRDIPDGKGGKMKEVDPFTDPLTIKHINSLGLYLPSRFGKELQKVKCFVLDLKHFVDRTADETIQIGKTRRKIKPKLRITYWCETCGEIANHKQCVSPKRCFICGSNEVNHPFNRCSEPVCCINCGQNHLTNSYECNAWKLKIVNDNDYIATILVGEGIVSSKKHILKYSGNNSLRLDSMYNPSNDIIEKQSFG